MAQSDFATPDFIMLPLVVIGAVIILGFGTAAGVGHSDANPAGYATTRIEVRLDQLAASGYLSVAQSMGNIRGWRRSQLSQALAKENVRRTPDKVCKDIGFSLDAKHFGEQPTADARTYLDVEFPKVWQETRTRSDVEAQLAQCVEGALSSLAKDVAASPEAVEKARIAETWKTGH